MPAAPEVNGTSPKRYGTILVFLTAALMPVSRASVVPISAGALVRKMRPIEAVSVALRPRLTPLTRATPPLARTRLSMVNVAALVALNCAVTVLRPPASVKVPSVSVELMRAVELLEAGSAPRNRRVELARETGTVLAMRLALLLPAPVLSRVSAAAVTTTPAEASIEPCGPARTKVPAVTFAAPVKVLALASVRLFEPMRTRSPAPLTTPANVSALSRWIIERALTAMFEPAVTAPPVPFQKRPPARTMSRVSSWAVVLAHIPKVPSGLTVIVPEPWMRAPWVPNMPWLMTMLPSVTVFWPSQVSPQLTLVRVKPLRSRTPEPTISVR